MLSSFIFDKSTMNSYILEGKVDQLQFGSERGNT